MSWRALTNAEREALPIGAEGWRYKRGTTIPNGIWRELEREPVRYKSGGVSWAIDWCSNGVGTPSMQLIGSTKDYVPPVQTPEEVKERGVFHPLPKGGYLPARFGVKASGPKLKPGEFAFGNIKGPLQKKAPKE